MKHDDDRPPKRRKARDELDDLAVKASRRQRKPKRQWQRPRGRGR